MKVTEQKIDVVLEWVENDSKFSNQLEEQFAKMNTEVKTYLFDSVEESLTEKEKEYFVFIMQVIWYCMENFVEGDLNIDNFQAQEDKNWETAELHKNLDKKFDALFTNYEEEDLLAFVEDILGEEEITIPGKEIIFVLAKSLIDQIV